MAIERFCKLKGEYAVCPWDLSVDVEAREYWVGLFRAHFESILKIASGNREQSERARTVLARRLDEYVKRPLGHGAVTIITLDGWRTEALLAGGFNDPFEKMKEEENAAMLKLLPRVCQEVDGMAMKDGAEAVIRGIFAGNIFDMGAHAAMEKLDKEGMDFFRVRDSLPGRPWLIDDFDC